MNRKQATYTLCTKERSRKSRLGHCWSNINLTQIYTRQSDTMFDKTGFLLAKFLTVIPTTHQGPAALKAAAVNGALQQGRVTSHYFGFICSYPGWLLDSCACLIIWVPLEQQYLQSRPFRSRLALSDCVGWVARQAKFYGAGWLFVLRLAMAGTGGISDS